MKCNKCGNEIALKLGAKVICKGCKVLTAMTTIVTVQRDKCGAFFQMPISNQAFLSVKEKND